MVEVSLIYFLVMILSAILGIQIAQESVLALSIKERLRLLQPYPKRLVTLGKFSTWRRMLGTIVYVLSPLIIAIIVCIRLHYFLSELLSCSRCTSTWIFGILQYFVLGVSLSYAILFAPLAIGMVYILERIER